MLFNSLEFIIFLSIVVPAHFLIPRRLQWFLLLACSYYFYMCWRPEYALLLLSSTVIDYYAGMEMGKCEAHSRRRKELLAMSLAGNLGLLFSFKYFDFFNDSIRLTLSRCGMSYPIPSLSVLLPIGISFYTFQSLSYSIDVYRGVREPERHLGIFALYVSFFPQLVAGPIERSTRLLPQFRQSHPFNYERFRSGLILIVWGLFKKLVIADRLAMFVDGVYASPEAYSRGSVIAATYLFGFQIYCDFSGYSDIAIGTAGILGYDLMKNFERPYLAASIRDFWRRWHMSLSTWLRDYLYKPLGGSRGKPWVRYRNLGIVFLLCGLWHGANWTFVAWGALHGAFLIAYHLTQKPRNFASRRLQGRVSSKVWTALGWLLTFNLVSFSWVFFRAESLEIAGIMLRRLFDPGEGYATLVSFQSQYELHVVSVALLVWGVIHILKGPHGIDRTALRLPRYIRWPMYSTLVLGIMVFGVFDLVEFIYFQF